MAKPPALIAGPYTPPRCKIGGLLPCKLRGDVPVDGMTDAPIQWPYTRYRGAGVLRSAAPMIISVPFGPRPPAIASIASALVTVPPAPCAPGDTETTD